MKLNYCYTCDQEYKTYSNLNKHFRTKKHDYYSNAIANKVNKEYKSKGVKRV